MNGQRIGNNQQQQQISVPLTDDDKLYCQCGSDRFVQNFYAFKLPSVIVGNTAQVHIQPIFICQQCGEALQLDKARVGRDIEN